MDADLNKNQLNWKELKENIVGSDQIRCKLMAASYAKATDNIWPCFSMTFEQFILF